MTKPPSVYASKVDWWLAALLVALPLFVMGCGVRLTFLHVWLGLGVGVFGLLLGALMARMLWPCHYVLTDRSLIIRCGWDEETILFTSIKSASPTRNPLSAPALSLQRVQIVLDQGYRLISPRAS